MVTQLMKKATKKKTDPMNVFSTLSEIPEDLSEKIVVIGNFDGVHRGHQALLHQAQEIASETNSEICVLTFEPHPRKIFRPDDPPFRITPPNLKSLRLQKEGIHLLCSLPFDWTLASCSAEDFVQNILINRLHAKHVVVGHDFRFGQLRKGSAETIRTTGIPVTEVKAVSNEAGQIISSSTIRQHLRHGRIQEANTLLGWNWEIHGTVVKGDQRGRKLGYPTANFPLAEIVHPAYGIYAAKVRLLQDQTWYNAAINIGIRPMFEIPEAQVESHILDFDQDIYGQTLVVRPVHFLRGEAKFDSVEDLISQMEKDCSETRTILRNRQ